MLTKFLVLCACLAVSVVTANPLLQALASQTCPICEQNSLKSQLQNLLLQSLQPYPQVYFNPSPPAPVQPVLPVEQPCSLCPTENRPNQNFQPTQNRPNQNFQQTHNRQNQNFQIPPCQQTNQPYCPRSPTQPQNKNVPDSVNKLLSNPNLRNILDPNTKLFNQNGVEVPRNGVCSNRTPNVVNNYFIVPPDFLLDDKTSNLKGDRKNPAERREKNRTSNSNQRTEDKKDVNSEVAPDNTRVIENSLDNGKRKQRRRQRNKHPDVKVKVVQENTTQEINQTESPQPIEQINIQNKQDKSVHINNTNNYNNSTTTLTPSEKIAGKVDEQKDIENLQSKSRENISSTTKSVTQQEDTQYKNEKETTTGKPHKNVAKPKPKKSTPRDFSAREEAVLKDFRRKFPNIPEDVVRNLIEHMRRQLRQQNFNAPTFYYPQFPISYDQLFRNQFSQTPIVVSSQGKKHNSSPQRPVAEDQNRSTKRRKNRRNKNQQTPKSTTLETKTTTESTPVSTTTNPTTTTTEVPLSAKVATEIKQPENIEADGILHITVPTQQNKDIEPKVLIKELADEYYPDFTDDHQYYSNEDFSFVVLEDDRFHYTTDKNVELEELNRERRRFDVNSRKNARHPEGRYILRLNKNRDKSKSIARQNKNDKSSSLKSGIHTEIPKIVVKIKSKDTNRPKADEDTDFAEWNLKKPTTLSDEKEIQFRTPPTLEKIDFETKQVNKKHNSCDETKTSSYSDFKTPQYNYNKNDEKYKNVDNINRPMPKIETDYANSKVATYGKPNSIEVSTEKDIWMDIDKEYSRIENDGRKVVFAKTIDGDFW